MIKLTQGNIEPELLQGRCDLLIIVIQLEEDLELLLVDLGLLYNMDIPLSLRYVTLECWLYPCLRYRSLYQKHQQRRTRSN